MAAEAAIAGFNLIKLGSKIYEERKHNMVPKKGKHIKSPHITIYPVLYCILLFLDVKF